MAFRHISDDTVHLTGGQRNVACRLLPGETLRLPLIVMLNYKGRDLYAAMNLWRHWFIECNMRWVDGRSDSERNVNNHNSVRALTRNILSGNTGRLRSTIFRLTICGSMPAGTPTVRERHVRGLKQVRWM